MNKVAISTWFVSDDSQQSTFFPQIGAKSDAPEAKKIYWQCVLCFFASSVVVNREYPHFFFTNSELPTIDGVDVAEALRQWKVGVVHLPITFRLPLGRVKNWGNQFYIFDIISHLARSDGHTSYIVLDSDCLWMRPVGNLEDAISRYGVLTYQLDEKPEVPINGLSPEGMARFLRQLGGETRDSIPYFGGEIFAATADELHKLAAQVARSWSNVLASDQDTPKEEAHLLSALYALNNYQVGTANPFLKRLWTTFKHRNFEVDDLNLTIWHLPAEKKFGFRDLFSKLRKGNGDYRDPASLGFRPDLYASTMGIPHRNARKFLRDGASKVWERIAVRS